MVEPPTRAAGVSPQRTMLVSIAAAGVLVGVKLGVGLATGSLALVSAGIESSGDVIAATITFFAVRLGRRPADSGHPYGHRRAENLGALGESAILLAGGAVVSVQAIKDLASGTSPPQVHWYLFAVVGLALAIDASRVFISLSAARRLASPALRSNALHFASDMAGSVAVLAGLLAVRAGFEAGDSVAALVVAALIFAAATRLITENANVLMDRAPAHARETAERAIASLGSEIELRRLRLRESAGRYFADLIVSVPAGAALVQGHQAADLVEQAIEQALPGSDVVVHVEPRRRGLDLRDRVLAIALSEPLVKEAHDITIFQLDGLGERVAAPEVPGRPRPAQRPRGRRAHRACDRGEAGVADVQTHLEPLEQPLPSSGPERAAERRRRREIERVVRERTGSDPRDG